MFIKRLQIFILLIIAFLFTGCSISIPGVVREQYQMGDIDYEIIDISSKSFNELNAGEFKDWYELNYKNGGVFNLSQDGIKYILISAGERLTSGYSMKDIELKGEKDEIKVYAKLYGPKEGEVTNQVITYPHVLISTVDDGRKLTCKGVELQDNSKIKELKKDTGRLDEITDDGIMRVKISGVPDNMDPKEFIINDKVKESIKGMEIKKGMEIIFTYYLDDDEKPVVVEVDKM